MLNWAISAASLLWASANLYLYLRRLTDRAAKTSGVVSLSVKRITQGTVGSGPRKELMVAAEMRVTKDRNASKANFCRSLLFSSPATRLTNISVYEHGVCPHAQCYFLANIAHQQVGFVRLYKQYAEEGAPVKCCHSSVSPFSSKGARTMSKLQAEALSFSGDTPYSLALSAPSTLVMLNCPAFMRGPNSETTLLNSFNAEMHFVPSSSAMLQQKSQAPKYRRTHHCSMQKRMRSEHVMILPWKKAISHGSSLLLIFSSAFKGRSSTAWYCPTQQIALKPGTPDARCADS